MRFCSYIVLSVLPSVSWAFQTGPRQLSPALLVSKREITRLNVGFSPDWNDDWNSEEDAMIIMSRAQTCAESDSCSLEDAKLYLDNVLHIQSGCASGGLVGNAVCENVDGVAEVVANLRGKIQQETKRLSVLSNTSGAIQVSVVILLLSAFTVAGAHHHNPDVAPFTPQEWWWAVRDGYFLTMLGQYFQHGGLQVSADYNPETVPFTLQEWWWGINGGYLNKMIEEYFYNGGLATTAGAESTPFTPQEWYQASRDGYLPTMLAHNFQHGGLANGADYESGVLPLTPDEWIRSAKDGYLPTMVGHYVRNGGL